MNKVSVDQNKSFNSHIGDIIKQRRKSKKITQEELATELGLSRFSISNIENGNQSLSFYQAFKVANYLNEQLTTFVDGFQDKAVFDDDETEKLSKDELDSIKSVFDSFSFEKKDEE